MSALDLAAAAQAAANELGENNQKSIQKPVRLNQKLLNGVVICMKIQNSAIGNLKRLNT